MFEKRKAKKEAQRAAEQARLDEVERLTRQRIEEERQETPKSGLRNVRAFDEMASRRQFKKEEKKVEAALKAERKLIAKEKARARRKYYIILAVVLAGIIGGAIGSLYMNSEKHYQAAVNYVLQEDYKKAQSELKFAASEKADNLESYVKIQMNLKEYKGNPKKLSSKLSAISNFSDNTIKAHYRNACQQINLVEVAQDDIDAIRLSEVSADKQDLVDEISGEIDLIEERYRCVLNSEKYDKEKEAVQSIMDGEPVGTVMQEIAEIGEVTLDSEKSIEKARRDYNRLDRIQKPKVLNYNLLTDAEKYYEVIRAAEDERLAKLEAEKKAKEEAAKKAKEAAGKTSETTEEAEDITDMTEKE